MKLPYGDQAQDQRIKRTREIRHSEGRPAPSRARTCCCQEHRGYAVVKNHMKGLPSLQIRVGISSLIRHHRRRAEQSARFGSDGHRNWDQQLSLEEALTSAAASRTCARSRTGARVRCRSPRPVPKSLRRTAGIVDRAVRGRETSSTLVDRAA